MSVKFFVTSFTLNLRWWWRWWWWMDGSPLCPVLLWYCHWSFYCDFGNSTTTLQFYLTCLISMLLTVQNPDCQRKPMEIV